MANPKQVVGEAAAKLVSNGMTVGLGTGTTAKEFILALSKRDLNIKGVATSEASKKLAEEHGIPTISINSVSTIDLTIDGADEVDGQKRLIKGGGGALLREKVVAHASHEMVVIIDPSKRVHRLGTRPVPLEVTPFGWKLTLEHLERLGYHPTLRMNGQKPFQTENGNVVIDVTFPMPPEKPEEHDQLFKNVPGVLETGFFFHLANKVLIGQEDGTVLEIE